MTQVRYDRLEKLAYFLDELPRKKFYFEAVVLEFDRRKNCGTICCAIGWTPVVFPRLIKYDGVSSIQLLTDKNAYDNKEFGYYIKAATELFGISEIESETLFSPERDLPWHNKVLGQKATPKQVARSIRRFITWKKKGNAL